MELNDICGVPHAKRAIEIALAGGFSILFTGVPESGAESLATYCTEKGLETKGSAPCPCGYYKYPSKECTCSIESVASWVTSEGLLLDYDITIEVPVCPPEEIVAWLDGKRYESDDVVNERIGNSTKHQGTTLDDTCQSLLRAAITQLAISYQRADRVIKIARVVANLAHSEEIHAAHLAEAIQYLPRRNRL